MNVLRRLPFSETPTTLEFAGETIPVRPFQIILWVSLSLDESLLQEIRPIPAILDTGHNHNFTIRLNQLNRWAGIQIEGCPKLGVILVNRQEVPLIKANLWIHRNRPGSCELLEKPVHLSIPEGVSVFPEDSTIAPRLPLLGLRGLARNGWRTIIEGTHVSLSRSKRPS